MNVLRSKSIFIALLFIVQLFSAGIQVLAQNPYFVKTKAGKLVLERNEDRIFQVKLANKVLFESEVEYGSIEAAFPQKNPSLILLSIGEGALACAVHFYIVDVSKSKPFIDTAFGNCNPAPKILYKNQTLTVAFPDGRRDKGAYKYSRKEVWQYRSGKLRRIL